MPRKR
jgi:hypothetical protein